MKRFVKRTSGELAVEKVTVKIYRIPTDLPESDGTLQWDSTSLVLVQAAGGGQTGLGYTYADPATAKLIHGVLASVVEGRDAMAIPACWDAMLRRTRNLGRAGIVSMAISAVDTALWDLKARFLEVPLVTLLGAARGSVPRPRVQGGEQVPVHPWAAAGGVRPATRAATGAERRDRAVVRALARQGGSRRGRA